MFDSGTHLTCSTLLHAARSPSVDVSLLQRPPRFRRPEDTVSYYDQVKLRQVISMATFAHYHPNAVALQPVLSYGHGMSEVTFPVVFELWNISKFVKR